MWTCEQWASDGNSDIVALALRCVSPWRLDQKTASAAADFLHDGPDRKAQIDSRQNA
jgi:hypothetical protein